MGKGGKALKGDEKEIFVCDFCNMFEGSYGLVLKHEKMCKREFDLLCKRAGTYVDEKAEKLQRERDEVRDLGRRFCISR